MVYGIRVSDCGPDRREMSIPIDGTDGTVADAAACQNELERMAMTIHTLAQGHKHLQSSDPTLAQACLKRADETLKVFFLDEDTR